MTFTMLLGIAVIIAIALVIAAALYVPMKRYFAGADILK